MYAKNVLVASGALIAAVVAVPMPGEHHHQHHARELVWATETEQVIVTVPTTKTVWIEPGETPPTEHHPQSYAAPSTTAAPEPAAYTPSSSAAPVPTYTPETSSSTYVAPPAYTPEATSTYVAPAYTPETTSTSVYVAPTPESTYVAPTSYEAPTPSSSYEAPAASSSAPSYGGSSGGLSYGMAKAGTSYTGDLTYFTPGLGACGETSTESDHMVAVSEAIFDAYTSGDPNKNPLCGLTINIKGNDGSNYPATIWDRCPGCSEADLDLPQAFFDMVTKKTENGPPADGRAHGMEWTFA